MGVCRAHDINRSSQCYNTAFVQQHLIHRKFKVALFLQKVIENRERSLPNGSHPQESTRAELTHTEVTDTRLVDCRAPHASLPRI